MSNNFQYKIKLKHGLSYATAKTTIFTNVENLQSFLLMLEKDVEKWYWFNVYSGKIGVQLAAYTPKHPPTDIGVTEDECRRMLAAKEKRKQRKREKATYERMIMR